MLRIILTRMWRARRLMAILLVSMCLVNGFLALSPLYVQAIAGAEFDRRVERTDDRSLLVDVINNQPLADDVATILHDQMDDYIVDLRHFSTVSEWLCGAATPPESNTIDPDSISSTAGNCFRAFAYQTFDKLFSLVDGRLPDQANRTDGVIETVVTSGMAEHDLVGTGSVFTIAGEDRLTVEVVGIVDMTRPQTDPFWIDQMIFAPTITAISPVDFRTDFAFIVSPEVYADAILPITEAPQYRWRAQLDRSLLQATRIPELSSRLAIAQRQIIDVYPGATFSTGVDDLITRFESAIAIAEGPVLVLSVLVVLLLLYNLTTIASLILQQQLSEWAQLAGRGASRFQLVMLQFVTMLLLGVVAFLIGPFLAQCILIVLSFVGPQADILDVGRFGPITSNAVVLSLAATMAAVVVMTIPAWTAADSSLEQLKQGAARPTKRPIWARAFLDLILIVLGLLFLLRLVSLAVGTDMGSVLSDPSLIIQALSGRAGAAVLTDPFSLLSPALILTGLALLWMRLFPYIVNLFGRFFGEMGLASRLALWTVERDSAHYAQLVLVLIGTLALGTASLILTNTHTLGAWQLAQQQTGTDAVVTLNLSADASSVDWEQLPDVEASLPVMIVEANAAIAPYFVGVNSDDLADFDPQMAESLTALQSTAARNVGGVAVPEDTVSMAMDVYAEPSDDPSQPIDTRVALLLLDDNSVRRSIEMTPPEDASPGEFHTHTLTFDADRPGTWTLLGIQFNSRQGEEEFSHVVYLDHLRAIAEDGTETVVLPFDEPNIDGWRWTGDSRQVLEGASLRPETAISSSGDASLRVSYRIEQYATGFIEPQLLWQSVVDQPLPIVASSEFADLMGQRGPLRRPFEVGEGGTTTFLLRYGYDHNIPVTSMVAGTNVDINYQIIDFWDSWQGLPQDSPYVIAELPVLQQALNARASDQFPAFEMNRVFLQLSDRQPSQDLIAALQAEDGVYSVDYAWHRYVDLQRDPLPNAVTGMLYAGFWVSLVLSLIDFGFYIAVTIQQRRLTFATLLAMGWHTRSVLRMLLVEQAAFVVPSLIIGLLIGGVLAYLLLPLLGLLGALALQVPIVSVIALVVVLVAAFVVMLWLMAGVLRRAQVATMMRFGE